MRKVRWFLSGMFLLLMAAVLAPACTSSQSNVATNPGYQGSYQSTSRSRQSSQAGQEEGFPKESYRPPVTLEMLAMNTGEVLVAEQYFIAAVVSNPESRALTYRWTVEDGTFAEVPESMRSEIIAYMQQLEQAKGVPEAAGASTPATPPGGGQPAPKAGAAPSAPSGTTGKPASAPPAPETAPSKPGSPPAEESSSATPEMKSGTEEAGAQVSPASGPPEVKSGDGTSKEAKGGPTSGANESTQASAALARFAVLGPEDIDESAETVGDNDTSAEKNGAEPAEGVSEEETSESAAEQPDEAGTAEAGAASGEEAPAEEPSAVDTAEDVAAQVESEVESQSEQAGEFAGFQPKAGTGHLVEVEEETAATEEEASEEGSAETEEPPLVEFTTDKPYVLWTAPALGTYTISLVVKDNKGNELTPLRSFPVTVTEPIPRTELVWNTTRKLLEDDYLVVELRGANIPAFDKGLFTISFDPTRLSFKIAEPGSFFPEGYHTSIYFAQPPGGEGKVTIAIAAEEVGLPKGDGVIARTIFKVKDNVDDPSSLAISEAAETDSRYILNPQQENVLPAVASRPVFATEWVEPPAAPQQTRPGAQTGQQAPETPAPPAQEEKSRPPRPTFGEGVPSGETTPSATEESEHQPSGGSPEELATEGEQTPTIQAPEAGAEMSLEDKTAMLEGQKDIIRNDPNLSEEKKLEALARLDEQIANLKSGEVH